MPTAFDIEGTVFQGGSATLLARVVGADGTAIGPGTIAAASYTIAELDENDDRAATPISGHENVSLTPSAVVFSPLETDLRWTVDATGYNFRHAIDVSTHAAFPEAGWYRVTYRLTPSSGQVILVRFTLRAI